MDESSSVESLNSQSNNQTENDEEDIYVYLPFENDSDLAKIQTFDNLQILGIEGPNPIFQIDKNTYQGTYKSELETMAFFEKNSTGSLEFVAKTPKVMKLSSIVLKPKKFEDKKSRLNTPNASNLTKTPNNHADRFIPIRSNAQLELGHFKLTQSPEDKFLSPSMREKQRIYSENLHGTNISSKKILSFNLKPPAPPEGHINPLRSFYSKTPGSSAKSSTRHIPQDADRILDAPDMVDDYYLNLIDWSSNNVLAVALRNVLYLWNASEGVTEQLMELPESEIICSVKWLNGNHFLAIGTSTGAVSIWDCQKKKNLRIMDGHTARVPSLSWNEFVLSSGSRSGHINNHDVRKRDHLINRIAAHSQEVCGLSWSTDGRYLASGGNDNIVNIWSRINDTSNHCGSTPLYTLTDHQSAVKALAWCPWQSNLLATGGGTADRMIRIWNSSTGTQTQSVDARSQVCSLLWSTNYRELVSGHGFTACQITIWKYPSMSVVTELNGHSLRILNLALSPDGTTVVSAGADETLRLWKCFQVDQSKKKDKTVAAKSTFESIKHCIR